MAESRKTQNRKNPNERNFYYDEWDGRCPSSRQNQQNYYRSWDNPNYSGWHHRGRGRDRRLSGYDNDNQSRGPYSISNQHYDPYSVYGFDQTYDNPEENKMFQRRKQNKNRGKSSTHSGKSKSCSNWNGYPDDQGWSGYPKEYYWETTFLKQGKWNERKPQIHKKTSDASNEQNEDDHLETIQTQMSTTSVQTEKQEPLDNTDFRDTNNEIKKECAVAKLVNTLTLDHTDQTNITKREESGFLIEVDKTSTSISLAWNIPGVKIENIQSYEIKYREFNNAKSKWMSFLTDCNRKTCTVPDLKGGTEYEFKVRSIDTEGEEGSFSNPTVKYFTQKSLAKELQLEAEMIKNGFPKVFKLPVKNRTVVTSPGKKFRICSLGTKSKLLSFKEKNIMLVGATGSGKSTLIDAVINYITDVSWEDDFRFTLVDLIDEEKMKKNNQEMSQTEWITCYKVQSMTGSKISFNLNIIDTPGFGDTRGIVRDKMIVDQIRDLFTSPSDVGILYLDAVCFVTQAPLARLTPPQRYIFDSILSIFGNDIASNIYVLITFADGNEPPVLNALKAAKVPFEKSFNFNNSALFTNTDNETEANFGKLFWKMGQESLRLFLDQLQLLEPKSLRLTAEVLEIRQNLEATVQGLQPQIADGLNILNTIRQEEEVLQRHKDQINCNKNFTYKVKEFRMIKEDTEVGKCVTNCLVCNRTCHYPCKVRSDEKKHKCSVMDTDGFCTVCPGECEWHMHKNNSFRFVTMAETVTKTYEELKSKYEIAIKEEIKQRSVVETVKHAFTSMKNRVASLIQTVRIHLNKLNQIALRPNPLSDIDYIDLLIQSEIDENKDGWKERVALYKNIRNEAELVSKAKDENFEPWGDDGNILGEKI